MRDFSLIDADNFSVRFCAAFDGDTRFGDMKMFGKKFNQSGVGFAVVWFGAKINDEFVLRARDDFFLRSAGFDGNSISFHNLFDDKGAAAGSVIEIFSTGLGKSDDGAADWGGVIENLLASIRIIAGKDDDVKVVRYAIMVGKRISVTVSQINYYRIAVCDFGVELVKSGASSVHTACALGVSIFCEWSRCNPVSFAAVSSFGHAFIESCIRVVSDWYGVGKTS